MTLQIKYSGSLVSDSFFLLINKHSLEIKRKRRKKRHNGNLMDINKSQIQVCNVTNKNKRKTSAKQASILEYVHWFSDKCCYCDIK